VTATNKDYYDAAVEPRASRPPGNPETWQSDDTAPTDFRVSGVACD
jgi:hypothetical protein